MINFLDPSRWIILRYRPGSGGKFLCACLMTIDKISHWDSRVEYGQMTYRQWVDTQWQCQEITKWVAFEPLHDWDTTFFSRTFPRGNGISLEDYNISMNQTSSEYLKTVWQSEKILLDFMHKQKFPRWWQESYHITLDARKNCDIHKKFLLSKIYPWDPETGMGTSMMDKPLDENKYQNARVFANQYEWGPFANIDAWYEHIWTNDHRLNFDLPDADLLLDDLLDYQRLKSYIEKTASALNSQYNSTDLEYVYVYWMEKTRL